MPFNDDDAAALMNDAEVLRRQVKALQTALVAARAETLAAVHLGDPDFGPTFVGSLAATVTADGRASVCVVTKNGKPKMQWDAQRKRLVQVGDADLVAVTKERFPQLPWRKETVAADDHKAVKASDQELLARLRAEHRSQVQPLVSPADIAAAKARNPWAKGTENLTLQMKIIRHDKTLAAQLQADAGTAA
jgi:hypothetical protein